MLEIVRLDDSLYSRSSMSALICIFSFKIPAHKKVLVAIVT